MRQLVLTESEAKVLFDICERLTRGKVMTFGGREHRYYDVYRSKLVTDKLTSIEKKLMRAGGEK